MHKLQCEERASLISLCWLSCHCLHQEKKHDEEAIVSPMALYMLIYTKHYIALFTPTSFTIQSAQGHHFARCCCYYSSSLSLSLSFPHECDRLEIAWWSPLCWHEKLEGFLRPVINQRKVKCRERILLSQISFVSYSRFFCHSLTCLIRMIRLTFAKMIAPLRHSVTS